MIASWWIFAIERALAYADAAEHDGRHADAAMWRAEAAALALDK